MVKTHTRPDEVIAANDIGAISYISDRPALTVGLSRGPELLEQVKGLTGAQLPARPAFTLAYLLKKRRRLPDHPSRMVSTLVPDDRYFHPVFTGPAHGTILSAAATRWWSTAAPGRKNKTGARFGPGRFGRGGYLPRAFLRRPSRSAALTSLADFQFLAGIYSSGVLIWSLFSS